MNFPEILFKFIFDYINKNKFLLRDSNHPAVKNRVNLHRWFMENGEENLGDYLSYVIVEYMKKINNIDDTKELKKTKHLYAAGSIIDLGLQNATIWGSGYIIDKTNSILFKAFCKIRELDIRCVRGPQTRRQLLSQGFECPEVYGDPVLLMPYIYQPQNMVKTKEYCIIKNHCDKTKSLNQISVITTDYKAFIDKLVSCKKVISSSLHGIILAEAYGIPAVLYIPDNMRDIVYEYKYRDYYSSTGRNNYPVARSINEALSINPIYIPDFRDIQKNLIETFPSDLWNE